MSRCTSWFYCRATTLCLSFPLFSYAIASGCGQKRPRVRQPAPQLAVQMEGAQDAFGRPLHWKTAARLQRLQAEQEFHAARGSDLRLDLLVAASQASRRPRTPGRRRRFSVLLARATADEVGSLASAGASLLPSSLVAALAAAPTEAVMAALQAVAGVLGAATPLVSTMPVLGDRRPGAVPAGAVPSMPSGTTAAVSAAAVVTGSAAATSSGCEARTLGADQFATSRDSEMTEGDAAAPEGLEGTGDDDDDAEVALPAGGVAEGGAQAAEGAGQGAAGDAAGDTILDAQLGGDDLKGFSHPRDDNSLGGGALEGGALDGGLQPDDALLDLESDRQRGDDIMEEEEEEGGDLLPTVDGTPGPDDGSGSGSGWEAGQDAALAAQDTALAAQHCERLERLGQELAEAQRQLMVEAVQGDTAAIKQR